ncbi:TBC1 domain family member 7 [Drosophila sechellia]|uniref:TBC1 domain family member 7 n=1 Tax=Drosophila sechellia TaxID=7238 RepID=B4HGJ2_DROSE|nr:TBC1 domain family member 7 [Drosophila sechellia]XP_032578038.1 TBC1 domain family member 7 [Drosophila sechellia]EDW43445.1 GM26567 [Drosophila sechellia]
MNTDERNFRSIYYEKCQINSVEEQKSLNKLLQDDIRNLSKLKQFCMNYTVPNNNRSYLWALVMGILPLHKSSTAYVRDQRREMYEDLRRAVTVLRLNDNKQKEPFMWLIDHKKKAQVMHTMWLIESNRLWHGNSSASLQADDMHFIEIVRTLLQIFDDNVETYWIAKGFYKYTRELKKECVKLKEQTQNMLKREDLSLLNHLELLGLFDGNSTLLDNWYITCFAGIICTTHLVKIWDKVCGGSRKIVVFLFVELVKDIRSSILKQTSLADVKRLIETVKDLDGVIIVNKAIKSLQNNSSQVEYTH